MIKKHKMVARSNKIRHSDILNSYILEGVNLWLTEAEEEETKNLISNFKLTTFNVDWNKLEYEMGVNIPDEIRYKYTEMYKSKTLTGSTLIKALSLVGIPFYVVASLIVGNYSAYGPGTAISGVVLGVIMMCYYFILQIIDWLDKKNKLSSINKSIVSKIIVQMREGGVEERDIKNAWGVAYQKIEHSIDWGEAIRILPVFNAVLGIILLVGFLLIRLFA